MLDLAGLAQQIADLVAARLEADAPRASVWLDVEGAAAHLACSPERVRKLVQRRDIPFHQERRGSRVFFNRLELDRWMLDQ